MNKSLFVSYADGREDVYPFPKGQSMLGSDTTCQYGIQIEGIAARHVLFSNEPAGTFVVNLQEPASVHLNGVPLNDRQRFKLGDELEVGAIRVRLQETATEEMDLEESPDGVAEVAESVALDIHAGWLGYRRIIEKISPFISPMEAETAEQTYLSGLHALTECLVCVIGLFVLAWSFDYGHHFLLAEICRCMAHHVALGALLILTLRYHIRFAGRLFALLLILDSWQIPPATTWENYFSLVLGKGVLGFSDLLRNFFCGWILDIGAGCLFQKRRIHFLFRYLLLFVGLFWSWSFVLLDKSEIYGEPFWYLPLLTLVGAFPFWGRYLRKKWTGEGADVSFVLNQAFVRKSHIAMSHILTVLAVAGPLFYALSTLGIRERVWWDKTKSLALDQLDSGSIAAWYWINQGRYLEISDFDNFLLYHVPLKELIAKGPESPPPDTGDAFGREKHVLEEDKKAEEIEHQLWGLMGVGGGGDLIGDTLSLGPLGKTLCRQMAQVQLEPTNTLFFCELEKTLAPWRTPPCEDEKYLPIYLEENDNRETFSSGPNPKLYHAQLGTYFIGFSEETAARFMLDSSSRVIPGLVFLCLGCLFLWKRSLDSAVGLWMGIAMIAKAMSIFLYNDALHLLQTVQYFLWHWAVVSPLGGFSAGCLTAILQLMQLLVDVNYLPLCILFVLLCWPRNRERKIGRLARSMLFCAKCFVPLFLMFVFLGLWWGLFMILENIYADIADTFALLEYGCAWVCVCLVGAWMRRKRRFETEAPELGWEFFLGCLFLEISAAPLCWHSPFVPKSWYEPLLTSVFSMNFIGLWSGGCAILGCILLLRLCLKRDFLSVLTPNGFTFALFSVLVPVISEICNSLIGMVFEDSLLQSKYGERIVTIAVIVLVMSPLWKVLGKLSRRLSVRNLIRVESRINATLETVLDQTASIDARDEIFDRLAELGLGGYAFFARSSSDSFYLILKNGWNGPVVNSFRMSPYLRHCLGRRPRVVDLHRLDQDETLYFQAFELFRIGKRLHADCLLPICLGQSVRAILVTQDVQKGVSLPRADVFLENVNNLGLATVESFGDFSKS